MCERQMKDKEQLKKEICKKERKKKFIENNPLQSENILGVFSASVKLICFCNLPVAADVYDIYIELISLSEMPWFFVKASPL